MSDAPILEAHDLVKRFGDFEAVKGVSFAIEKGESLIQVGDATSRRQLGTREWRQYC